MISITNIIQLNELLQKQVQQVDINSLKISIQNEKLPQSNFLSELSLILPNLEELFLNFCSNNLNSTFLSQLDNFLVQQPKINKIDFFIHKNEFYIKKTIKFLKQIKRRFFPKELIQYTAQDQFSQIFCGSCKISYVHLDNENFLRDDIKQKILIFRIPKSSYRFYQNIFQCISEQKRSLFVTLELKVNNSINENLNDLNEDTDIESIYDNNCDDSIDISIDCYIRDEEDEEPQYYIRLIFEDVEDLFQYKINQHLAVFIRKGYDSFKNGFQLQLNSFRDQVIINKQRQVMYYQHGYKLTDHIKQEIQENQFDLKDFMDFAIPQIKERSKIICLNFYSDFKFDRFSNFIKFRFEKNNSIENLNISRLKYRRYQSRNEDQLNIYKYQNINMDYNYFINQISNFQLLSCLKKINIYIDKESSNLQLSFLKNLPMLEKLTLESTSPKYSTNLLSINQDNLAFSKQKYLQKLKIKNRRLYDSSFVLDTLEMVKKIQLGRIINIDIQKASDIPYILKQQLLKQKYLVVLQTRQVQNYQYYRYDNYEDDYSRTDYIYNNKLEQAYHLVDYHDDLTCSITRMEQCSCSNNQIQTLIKSTPANLQDNYDDYDEYDEYDKYW